MSRILVKNNGGIEVEYNDVEMVVLPTADGKTQTYRKWGGTSSA